MRRIRYGVAMSLDGYIAGPHGEIDWIEMDPEVDFAAIWAQFDTALMGRRTYEVAMQRLSEKTFAQINTLVFSRTMRQQDHSGVTVVSELSTGWAQRLKAQPGKDIWLFGGSGLCRSFLDCGCVDALDVMVLPVLLGDGLPLLPPPYTPAKLKLTSSKAYRSGRLALTYDVLPRAQE